METMILDAITDLWSATKVGEDSEVILKSLKTFLKDTYNSRNPLSAAEIASELIVSLETVKTHVSAILAKLGARDRTQAVIRAYDSGFVSPSGEGGESDS